MISTMTNEQIALSLADNRSRSPQETMEIAERYYEWLENKDKTKTQALPDVEERIKAIDKEIKEREKEIADAILRHKVWTGQIG
jgi:flagellar motility protein MotE (MotC chaperone)